MKLALFCFFIFSSRRRRRNCSSRRLTLQCSRRSSTARSSCIARVQCTEQYFHWICRRGSRCEGSHSHSWRDPQGQRNLCFSTGSAGCSVAASSCIGKCILHRSGSTTKYIANIVIESLLASQSGSSWSFQLIVLDWFGVRDPEQHPFVSTKFSKDVYPYVYIGSRTLIFGYRYSLCVESVILTVIGDEDHRVRNAVANCLISLVRTWTTSKVPPEVLRVKRLMSSLTRVNLYDGGSASFAGIPVSINGLCKTFRDTPTDENVVTNLTFFINELLQLLVTSSSKFTKVSWGNDDLKCDYCLMLAFVDGLHSVIIHVEHHLPSHSLPSVIRMQRWWQLWYTETVHSLDDQLGIDVGFVCSSGAPYSCIACVCR